MQLQAGSHEVFCAPEWALVKEREGHHQEAVAALELGLQLTVSQSSLWYWPTFVAQLVRLREAERQLTGSTARTDEIMADQRKSAFADWESRDPSTAAFDHVVATSLRTGRNFGSPVDAHLARGRRLTELGHIAAAEADFNKAVEFATNDPNVLAARGVFHADRGDAEQAAADFHAALNLLTDPARPRWLWGVPIDLEAAQRDEVFEKFASLRPEWDQNHWAVRTAMLVRSGDLDGAHAAAQRLTQFGQSPVRAAVAVMRGDRDEFERLRASANQGDLPLFQTILLALEPVEAPLTAELLTAAQRLAAERPPGSSSGADYYSRFWTAVAKLRVGNEREAVNEVETLLREHQAEWVRALGWPLLAIAYHKLGEPDAARQWLAKSELWSRWHSGETPLDAVRLFGPGKVLTHDWLYALVLHREARALIDADPLPVSAGRNSSGILQKN
jgi:Tfp pilus assembly protein PilF